MKTLSLVFLIACTSAPSTPTWQADVQPIIAANCIRCHGATPAYGAPQSFRLDVLEDSTNDPVTGLPIHGARTMYYRIMERVDDGSMPPELPLVGDAVDVIDNWAALAKPSDVINGFAVPPDPGGERAGNHAPTFSLAQGAAGGVTYAIDDADHDLVDGQLQVGGVVVARGMRSGWGTVHVDLSNVPQAAGATPVDLVLNDGV
ncbi:MAG TPA: hypothetical protein VL463_23415, partial [Kofleriaceae bacterium]|nr:hypothetical protein [Kofleriaceae bacterium]